MGLIGRVLCDALDVFAFALIIRVVLSYFPMSGGSGVARVYDLLGTVVEPVLSPVRRLVPGVRAGSATLDLSPMIVLIVIFLLRPLLC
jgi:YggT family protein